MGSWEIKRESQLKWIGKKALPCITVAKFMFSPSSAKNLRTMGKAIELVLMRKKTRSSLLKPIALQPQNSHLTQKSYDPLSAIPLSAQEEDMMSHGSHHQILSFTWASAADLSHFYSPKPASATTTTTQLSCLPSLFLHRGFCGLSQERGRHRPWTETSGHTQRKGRVEAGPAGCFPSLRPSLCTTHATKTFPASPLGWLI